VGYILSVEMYPTQAKSGLNGPPSASLQCSSEFFRSLA
jgi:hypothetical protein